jgi:hypothetical protein
MTIPPHGDPVLVDLSDLAVKELEVLAQQGARGMPEFAASCQSVCDVGMCSCVVSDSDQVVAP